MKQKYYMIPLLLCFLAITGTVIPVTYAKYTTEAEASGMRTRIAGISVMADSKSSMTAVQPGSETVIGSVTINYSGSEAKLEYSVALQFKTELPEGTKVIIGGKEAAKDTAKQYTASDMKADPVTGQTDRITYDVAVALPEDVKPVRETYSCSVSVKAMQAL